MSEKVVALCGGIGGAKLALGLYSILPPPSLTVVVNTGDDFEHLGFHISPDIDTVLYTLVGLADPERGWGRAAETWHFMEEIERFGGEAWFRLGDRDLAIHVRRRALLQSGLTLAQATQLMAERLGLRAHIVPMSDDPVRTVVETDAGDLPFQRYFVEQRCAPAVRGLRFAGAEAAKPCAGFLRALREPDLAAVIICPSNPYLSIDPILSIPGVPEAIAATAAPVIAVSPLVGGSAVKGPTAKIMSELGIAVTNVSIAGHYRQLIDGLIIDSRDAGDAASLGLSVHVTATLMSSLENKIALARDCLAYARRLSSSAAGE